MVLRDHLPGSSSWLHKRSAGGGGGGGGSSGALAATPGMQQQHGSNAFLHAAAAAAAALAASGGPQAPGAGPLAPAAGSARGGGAACGFTTPGSSAHGGVHGLPPAFPPAFPIVDAPIVCLDDASSVGGSTHDGNALLSFAGGSASIHAGSLYSVSIADGSFYAGSLYAGGALVPLAPRPSASVSASGQLPQMPGPASGQLPAMLSGVPSLSPLARPPSRTNLVLETLARASLARASSVAASSMDDATCNVCFDAPACVMVSAGAVLLTCAALPTRCHRWCSRAGMHATPRALAMSAPAPAPPR